MRAAGRSGLLALGLALGASCSAPGLPPPPVKHSFTTCTTPRPEVCTFEYLPVCAHLETGAWKTYPSACGACSDAEVVGWRPSPCEAE